MNAHLSLIRRIAIALMNHAGRVLPAARLRWAEAMKNEFHHIESAGEALKWAAGCVLASYLERSRLATVLNTWYARVFLTLLLLGEALNMLFAPVLTAAYHLHYLRVAAFLGGFTPGDDYRRLIPLMNAAPWMHGFWVAASVLFLASAWQVVRKNRSALPLFAAAWMLGATGDFIAQAMPAYREAFSFPTPMFTRDYLIPTATALAPLFIAAALWARDRISRADGSPEV